MLKISALAWKRRERMLRFNCKYLTHINMERNRRVTSAAMCSSQELLIKEQNSGFCSSAPLSTKQSLNHLWTELFITWMNFWLKWISAEKSKTFSQSRLGLCFVGGLVFGFGFFNIPHIRKMGEKNQTCLSGRMPWRHSLISSFLRYLGSVIPEILGT